MKSKQIKNILLSRDKIAVSHDIEAVLNHFYRILIKDICAA